MKSAIILFANILLLLGSPGCKSQTPELVQVGNDGSRFLEFGERVKLHANIPVKWELADKLAGEIVEGNIFIAGDSSGVFEIEAINIEDETDRMKLELWVSNRAAIFNELYHTGGYVLYFRHAMATVGADSFDIQAGWHLSCNQDTARQLSPEGIIQAQSLGKALAYTQIPLSDTVYSSEFCRCLKTLELMKIGTTVLTDSAITFHVYGEAQRHQRTKKFIDALQAGKKNIILSSHSFGPGADYPWLEQGYSAVFKPGSGPTFLTIIRDDEWIIFAKE